MTTHGLRRRYQLRAPRRGRAGPERVAGTVTLLGVATAIGRHVPGSATVLGFGLGAVLHVVARFVVPAE